MRLQPEAAHSLEVDEKTLVVIEALPEVRFYGYGPGAVRVEYTQRNGVHVRSVIPRDLFTRS